MDKMLVLDDLVILVGIINVHQKNLHNNMEKIDIYEHYVNFRYQKLHAKENGAI
jgi:hypothetical protein